MQAVKNIIIVTTPFQIVECVEIKADVKENAHSKNINSNGLGMIGACFENMFSASG